VKPKTIKNRVFASFFVIIIALCLCTFVLGFNVIKKDILEQAKTQVNHNLDSARSVFLGEIDSIKTLFNIVNFDEDLETLREKMGLDYLEKVKVEDLNGLKSEIVQKAAAINSCGGTRIIGFDELSDMGQDILAKANMAIMATPKSSPTTKVMLKDAMAIEYATVINPSQAGPKTIVYGGKIINRDFDLVDKIRNLVFVDSTFNDKPTGTVTIFQDDVRITTNVLDQNAKRAVGTRVSEIVYNKVVGTDSPWFDRAFVVTDWYLTAYEPIKNVNDDIIGILYVGTLEKPFNYMIFKIVVVFLAITGFAIALGALLSYFLATSIARPIEKMLAATKKISGGELGFKSDTDTSLIELNQLSESFNEMSVRLDQRDKKLKETNEKLAESNKSYVDLIGFVAHELKGLLASAIMNSYALRDGYLGMINFKQQRAIDSITRNQDYLAATVKKFLNLSRIERGEMELNKSEINLAKDVFEVSLETFSNQFTRNNIEVINNIDADLKVNADSDMMLIVANNLVSNAAKYGTKDGKIELTSKIIDDKVQIEVYNDGRPISDEAMEKLFKKFSRLDVPEKKTVKGTGLGLFITKEIIEAHGGSITVEPKEKGNSFIFQLERDM